MFSRHAKGLVAIAAHTCFLISIALCASESLSCRARNPQLSHQWQRNAKPQGLTCQIRLDIFTFRPTQSCVEFS